MYHTLPLFKSCKQSKLNVILIAGEATVTLLFKVLGNEKGAAQIYLIGKYE